MSPLAWRPLETVPVTCHAPCPTPLAPCRMRLESAAMCASEVGRVARGRAGAPTVRAARAIRHLAAQPRAHAACIAVEVQADAADLGVQSRRIGDFGTRRR